MAVAQQPCCPRLATTHGRVTLAELVRHSPPSVCPVPFSFPAQQQLRQAPVVCVFALCAVVAAAAEAAFELLANGLYEPAVA